MNIRHLQLPLALALAMGATTAHALGLGPIEVKSGLNQPLVAEIPILSAGPGELDELEVRLASPEAFARVGLERPVGLTANLQMEVGRNAAGHPVIRVTTPERFNEPYLTFLIEANWGRGSVVREFSALVDPPYIAPAVIRPMQAPTVAVAPAPPPPEYVPPQVEVAPEPQPEDRLTVTDIPPEPIDAPAAQPEPLPPEPVAAPPEPVAAEPAPIAAAPEPTPSPEPVAPEPEPLPEPEAPAPEPEPIAAAPPPPMPAPTPPAPASVPAPTPTPAPAPAADPTLGPVAEGQTLWGLADKARLEPGVSINQMMIALQRANPEAFIDDNINLLKAGAVLRMPQREEIVTLGEAEAAVLVREHANAWNARRPPVPQPAESTASVPAAAAPAAAPVAKAPRREPAAGARLEIVPPSGGELAARGMQSGASDAGGGNELRAELTQAREDLAAKEAEVEEMRSQIAELEAQRADSQRLLQLQDSRMKALQERLAKQQRDAVAAGNAPAARTPPAAAEPAATPAVASAAPWYSSPYAIGAAIVVLLAGLVLALRGRKRAEPVPVVGRRISDDEALTASLSPARADAVEAPDADDLAAAADAPAEDPETRRLRDAVAARPDDLEAHVGLLRHHYARGDAVAYDAAAQAMRAHVRSTLDPRWREAVVMGVAMSPSNPLFSQAGWNAPKFGDSGVIAATPPPVVPAPAPVVAPADLPPVVSEAEPEPESMPSFLRGAGVSGPATHAAREAELAAELQALQADLGTDALLSPADADDLAVEHDALEGSMAAEAGRDEEGSATKIELARAYLDIGDVDGARGMLEEVLAEGGPSGRAQAEQLLKEIG